MRRLSQGLVVFAGLLSCPSAPSPHLLKPADPQPDPRLVRLQRFFQERESPIDELAEDFIAAADANNLDWRLLPSISVIESGGGKDYRNNNIFGWDSCRRSFPTVRDGIHVVARRLRVSKLYKDKDLDQILETYNGSEYPARIKSVMRRLAPDDPSGLRSLN